MGGVEAATTPAPLLFAAAIRPKPSAPCSCHVQENVAPATLAAVSGASPDAVFGSRQRRSRRVSLARETDISLAAPSTAMMTGNVSVVELCCWLEVGLSRVYCMFDCFHASAAKL